MTLPTGTGIFLERRPPCILRCERRTCRLTSLTPHRYFAGFAVNSHDFAFLTSVLAGEDDDSVLSLIRISDYLARKTDNLHKAAVAQFTTRRQKYESARVLVVVDQNGGVRIELDIAAVFSTRRLLRANDYSSDNLVFLIWLPGITDFTEQTTISPSPAVRRWVPPNTLMHCSSLAPVLSADSKRVCI